MEFSLLLFFLFNVFSIFSSLFAIIRVFKRYRKGRSSVLLAGLLLVTFLVPYHIVFCVIEIHDIVLQEYSSQERVILSMQVLLLLKLWTTTSGIFYLFNLIATFVRVLDLPVLVTKSINGILSLFQKSGLLIGILSIQFFIFLGSTLAFIIVHNFTVNVISHHMVTFGFGIVLINLVLAFFLMIRLSVLVREHLKSGKSVRLPSDTVKSKKSPQVRGPKGSLLISIYRIGFASLFAALVIGVTLIKSQILPILRSGWMFVNLPEDDDFAILSQMQHELSFIHLYSLLGAFISLLICTVNRNGIEDDHHEPNVSINSV